MTDSEEIEEATEWDHDYSRSAFSNLVLLVEEVPEEVPDNVLEEIAYRSIAGLGPETARRALERIREEQDEENLK